jgi:hypothetical protein
MKILLCFNLFLILFSSRVFSTELSCSHYYHVNVHGTDANIIIWQQNINIELGVNDKELKDLLLKNQTKSTNILNMLSKNQKALAKLELEQSLGRKLNEADNVQDLALKLGRSALIEKELMPEKHDEYSYIRLKLLSKLELSETDEWVIVEALIVNVKNNLSNVQSSYYHSLNNYALLSLDSFSRTLNEYRLNISQFRIKNPQYGDILAVSYKCIYPNKTLTSSEIEQGYIKLIVKAQANLQELRTKSKKQSDNIQIKETEDIQKSGDRPNALSK